VKYLIKYMAIRRSTNARASSGRTLLPDNTECLTCNWEPKASMHPDDVAAFPRLPAICAARYHTEHKENEWYEIPQKKSLPSSYVTTRQSQYQVRIILFYSHFILVFFNQFNFYCLLVDYDFVRRTWIWSVWYRCRFEVK